MLGPMLAHTLWYFIAITDGWNQCIDVHCLKSMLKNVVAKAYKFVKVGLGNVIASSKKKSG